MSFDQQPDPEDRPWSWGKKVLMTLLMLLALFGMFTWVVNDEKQWMEQVKQKARQETLANCCCQVGKLWHSEPEDFHGAPEHYSWFVELPDGSTESWLPEPRNARYDGRRVVKIDGKWHLLREALDEPVEGASDGP